MNATKWLALRYKVPSEPSRLRVYVWRHIRALGAQSLAPTLIVLPDTHQNLEAFEALSRDVRRIGGETMLARFEFIDRADEEDMLRRFADAASREEQALLHRCAALADRIAEHGDGDAEYSAAVRELKTSLSRFRKSPLRPFSPKQKTELQSALEEVFETLRSLPAEVSAMLRDNER